MAEDIYYDSQKGAWVKGKKPEGTSYTKQNTGYVAPKSTDTFQYVAPEAYKAPTSTYTPEYYDALRNKYASDTQSTLTSPEMAEQAKKTRATMAGMGVLGGSAYGVREGQRVGEIQRAGDKALSDALSAATMQEQEWNKSQAEKVAASQADIETNKASALNQWNLGAGTRDTAALEAAKNSIKSQLTVLESQLGYDTAPDVVERYNALYDQLMQLEQGGDVADVDYAGNIISKAIKGQQGEGAMDYVSAVKAANPWSDYSGGDGFPSYNTGASSDANASGISNKFIPSLATTTGISEAELSAAFNSENPTSSQSAYEKGMKKLKALIKSRMGVTS